MSDTARSQPSRYTYQTDANDAGSSHAIMLSLVGPDRHVLDVGCASGDLARDLVARGCTVVGIELDPVAAEAGRPHLERLVVGDVETLDVEGALHGELFDVVVFGDVLEHLRDPLPVLRQGVKRLRRGGSVVVSIPNVAHASVRLSLLNGEFTYRDLGLLDSTHLRFYTRQSVLALLEQAGLVPVDVRRTVLGPFDGEIPLRREDVPAAALEAVMSDPDAITYQFVIEAAVDDAEGRVRRRAEEAERSRQELHQVRRELEQVRQDLSSQLDQVRRDLTAEQARRRAAEAEVRLLRQGVDEIGALRQSLAAAEERCSAATVEAREQRAAALEAREALTAVHGSTAWRVSAPVRALGPLRAALQGPAGSRRALRRRGAISGAAKSLREQGIRATAERVRHELTGGGGQEQYAEWLSNWGELSERDVAAIRQHLQTLHVPRISIVMPVYDTVPALLRAAVESVRDQLYENWQLCIVDDRSPTPATRTLLSELAAGDERIVVAERQDNGGISAASNDGLRMADGDYIAFMDHDDLLSQHALYLVAVELDGHPDAQILYSDEDKVGPDGSRHAPYFKPDYDHELLLAQNYLSHLTVMRRDLVQELGGLDETLDGAQDHDLLLRAAERVVPEQIRHIPWVLYHWRQYPGSGSFSDRSKLEATAASRSAVAAHLERIGEQHATVVPASLPIWNRVIRHAAEPLPGVTAVIPTRDLVTLLRQCVEGLLHNTDYDALQVLVVDNDSSEPETLEYLASLRKHPQVRVVSAPGPFNYSAINNAAVGEVDTPLLLLLNNDIAVREPDWLSEMVSLMEVEGTGAVGAKLLYGNGRVQHAGVILGIGGVAGHSHKHARGDDPGNHGRLVLTQSMSAVTGACLLTRTELYRSVGGLNETDLAVAFNDVDLCLRIRAAGYGITYAANAVLDHLESASRGPEETAEQVSRFNSEIDWMQKRWGVALVQDPAYNPNLTDIREDFSVTGKPRLERPWAHYL